MSLPTPHFLSQNILNEEEAKLATPLKFNSEPLHVVVFTINQQAYAIESRFIKEVFTIKELTPLFDMPPHFKGVVNLKRRIIAVFDLAIVLGLAPVKARTNSLAILLTNQLREFAIIIETVDRTETLPAESLSPYPGISQKHIKGEFSGQLILIDGETLIEDPHLLIQERANQALAQEND